MMCGLHKFIKFRGKYNLRKQRVKSAVHEKLFVEQAMIATYSNNEGKPIH